MGNTHGRDGKVDQASEKVTHAATPTGDGDAERAEEMTGKVETAIGRTLRLAADAITHAGRAAKD